MNQQLPPLPNLVPETAPFTAEQRSWLNGFFAGLVSLDSAGLTPLTAEQNAALMGAPVAKGPLDDGDDGEAPWHDQTIAIADRMKLAEGRPVRRRMMAAMAQQDCGQCGYSCEDYSNKIFLKEEERLNLCVPGGKETARMLKTLYEELGSHAGAGSQGARAGKPLAAPAGEIGRSRDNPATRDLPVAHAAEQGRFREGNLASRFRSHRMRARLCAGRFLRALSGERSGAGRCRHRGASCRRPTIRSPAAPCARS